MTKVLIDVALIAMAWLAGSSLLSSGRRFCTLFAQLRAEMAAGMPVQTMQVTTRDTGVEALPGPVPAMAYRPGVTVAANTAGALPVRPRIRLRSAAMRAAA